jgi:hypothetical protein
VSQTRAALVALPLAAAVCLAPAIGTAGGPDRATAADCAWQRHSKRIVKHVKRDGRRRRVVRTKHWWACNPLAAPPALTEPPAAPPPPSAGPAPAPELPRRVGAKVEDEDPEDFHFILSRPFVYSGEVTVELDNSLGGDPHNLNVQLEGSADPALEVGEAEPGESRVGHFDLAPGTYRLWCSLPQHEEWGMKADLEVRGG